MDRSKPAKRIGRPTKPPVEGERVPLGLRVTAEAKRKLEEAAIKSGRSISQEAELRIERSFDDERWGAAIAEQFKGFQAGFEAGRKGLEEDSDTAQTQSRSERHRQIRQAAKALHEDFLRAKKRRDKKLEKLSDEELEQIRQEQEEALKEQRKKFDAELKRVQERFDKEMEARYGPSKDDKIK
jgi:hypothetical protein